MNSAPPPRLLTPALLLLAFAALLPAAVDPALVEQRLQQAASTHPRLFLSRAQEPELFRALQSDPLLAKLSATLLRRADALLAEPPVERVLIGRRLLDKSRTCLSRVLHLGFAWRVTRDPKYAERARREMLAAAAFTDWNPSHFLDVAEMTAALGIGFDWFHDALSPEDRAVIRDAIVHKGLQPSLTTDGWSRATHNWNQVCNAGLAIGAIAVAAHQPALATRIVTRAIDTVPLAMHEYAPDGAYPEGASYWAYGTSFNVLLISALQSALGSDFGLTAQPGFLATADYLLHVFGPTGLPFNYSDAGSGPAGLEPAMFWFAAQRRQPYLLWSEWAKLQALDPAGSSQSPDRLDPLLPIWFPLGLTRPEMPPALSWSGAGLTPVAMHRSSWSSDATYIAIKGGSPSTNHAHMDVGTFVMDADGVRWADDLGMQSYHSLESKGVDLWGKGQQAGRWRVFRLGASAHNVPMVNGQPQLVAGRAPLLPSQPGRTVVDLTEIYRGPLTRAQRGVHLRPDRSVLVQDEYLAAESPAAPATVRWAMLTRADVRLDGPGRATLSRQGRTLHFRVLEPAGAELKIVPTDPPPSPTDAPNPGSRLLTFTLALPPGAAARVVVHLSPGAATNPVTPIEPLARW